MAFETKVILSLLARQVAGSKNLKEAYGAIAEAANVEGMYLPSYENMVTKIEKDRKEEKD